MRLPAFIQRSLCRHVFFYEDLIGRPEPDGDVTWPCGKCGKVFKAPCGLDVLRHGRAGGYKQRKET